MELRKRTLVPLMVALATLSGCETGDELLDSDEAELHQQYETWLFQAEGVDDNTSLIRTVAQLPNGQSITGGTFSGNLTLGSDTYDSVGRIDIFIARLDRDGSVIWSQTFGSTDNDHIYDIETDSEGSLYVTGTMALPISIAGQTLSSSGGVDFFVAKLDSSGDFLWATTGGGPAYDLARDLEIHEDEVWMVGTYSDSMSLGSESLVSNGNRDAFVAKLDSESGDTLLLTGAGGPSTDRGQGIAVSQHGNVFVTGSFEGSGNFFDGDNALSLGTEDIFLAKLDNNGQLSWVDTMGGTGSARSAGVVVRHGRVTLAGTFTEDIQVGNHSYTSNGESDILVASYRSNGNLRWVKTAGGSGVDFLSGISAGRHGLLLSGGFHDTMDIGHRTLQSNGAQDAFVFRMSKRGHFQCSASFGGEGDDSGAQVAKGFGRRVFLAGTFEGVTEFNDIDAESGGAEDGFLLSFFLRNYCHHHHHHHGHHHRGHR